MKRSTLVRLVVVSFVAACSLVIFKADSLKQPVEEQCADEEPITFKKRGSGEFIIWETMNRYIMAGYH